MALGLMEGVAAPDFRLPTAAGGEAVLSDYRGKWLVLFFYPKASTSG